MGHSILTIKREGLLDYAEVKSVVENKKSDDQFEYGHGESSDSWVHAEYPRAKNDSVIYSESAAREIVNNMGGYESMYLYYVSDSIWKSHFLANESKIEKIKTKVKSLNADLQSITDDALSGSGVKLWLDKKNHTDNVFIPCSDCKSKIHAPSYLWINKKLPERCPVCRADNPNLSNEWRDVLYGKRYTTKRTNLTEDVKKLQEDLTKLEACDIKNISISDLDNKGNENLKNSAMTLIAADIHH